MDRKKVLVTGAAGLIASQVLPALRERYELTLLDIRSGLYFAENVERKWRILGKNHV